MVFYTVQLPLILLGLALIVGSFDGGVLYLYDSTGHQVKFTGSHSKMHQMDVSKAGAQGVGWFLIYNQEECKGRSVKVESGHSVNLTWNTVKSIEYSEEECKHDVKNAGAPLFASLGTIVLLLFAFF